MRNVLDINQIYHVGDDVVMEVLEGGTVETVHSLGFGLFVGPMGNMKKAKIFVSEHEALEYILKRYKAVCDIHDWDYEINYVDDISTISEVDHMLSIIKKGLNALARPQGGLLC